jgi:hypothetical protein
VLSYLDSGFEDGAAPFAPFAVDLGEPHWLGEFSIGSPAIQPEISARGLGEDALVGRSEDWIANVIAHMDGTAEQEQSQTVAQFKSLAEPAKEDDHGG